MRLFYAGGRARCSPALNHSEEGEAFQRWNNLRPQTNPRTAKPLTRSKTELGGAGPVCYPRLRRYRSPTSPIRPLPSSSRVEENGAK